MNSQRLYIGMFFSKNLNMISQAQINFTVKFSKNEIQIFENNLMMHFGAFMFNLNVCKR